MKNINISLLLGFLMIGVCIVIAGSMISSNMPATPAFPNTLTVSDNTNEFGEFLNFYEASAFLGIADWNLRDMIEQGTLNGTYIIADKDSGAYVFSRDKLSERINSLIGEAR